MSQSGQSKTPPPTKPADADRTQTSGHGLPPVVPPLPRTRDLNDEDRTEASAPTPPKANASDLLNPVQLINKRIGKYRILRLLGQGGMGAVFEALDTILNRKVALKVLPAEVTSDDKALKRFVREAQSAAALTHRNVVMVYDIAKVGEICFIVMELVVGKSAQDIVSTKGRLSVADATKLMAEACRGLAAAHHAGLIHRDIKPGNILRADDGTVKLSDFGLAKSIDSSANHYTITQQNAVLGTPKYMSPEQAQSEPLDRRSDIYSMGATYYALLTGQAPFNDGTVMQVLYAHCTKPTPDPRQQFSDIPAACAQIIFKAMAKDPASRYESADEMLGDLESVLAMASGQIPVAELASLELSSPVINPLAGLKEPSGPASFGPMSLAGPIDPTVIHQNIPDEPWYYDQNKQVAVAAGAVALVLTIIVGVIILSSGGETGAPVAMVDVERKPYIEPPAQPARSDVPANPVVANVAAAPAAAAPAGGFIDASGAADIDAQRAALTTDQTNQQSLAADAQRELAQRLALLEQRLVEQERQPAVDANAAPAGPPAATDSVNPADGAEGARTIERDPAYRKFVDLKADLADARLANNAQSVDKAVAALVDYYSYLNGSPISQHTELAAEAAKLAESHKPGSTADVTFSRPPSDYFAKYPIEEAAPSSPIADATRTAQAGADSGARRPVQQKFNEIEARYLAARSSNDQAQLHAVLAELLEFYRYFAHIPESERAADAALGIKAGDYANAIKPGATGTVVDFGPPPNDYLSAPPHAVGAQTSRPERTGPASAPNRPRPRVGPGNNTRPPAR